MARWEANARARLQSAALDLFEQLGYDATTVADIADHAGVTSRTYFRYFPDKREALFGGAVLIGDRIARTLRDAPAGTAPWSLVVTALASCDELFTPDAHHDLRRRDALVRRHGELQEREAAKLSSIADTVAAALLERGHREDQAVLIGELAAVTFKQASHQWMDDPSVPYDTVVRRALAQVRQVLDSGD